MITDSFSAHAFVMPLVRYLDQWGWESVIACSSRNYDDAHSFTAAMRNSNLDVRDVDLSRSVDPINDVRQLRHVMDLIREESPALVHTHLAKAGIIGRVAASLLGVPCVHTVYDYAFVEHRGIRRQVYRRLEQICAPMARRILFVSENERRISLDAGIGKPQRLITIGFGVDTALFDRSRVGAGEADAVKQRFGIPRGRLVVGAVARLVHRKRIDLLLRAMVPLIAEQLDAHVLIVGGGPLRDELIALAFRLKLGDRVSFSGFIDDQGEMPAVFAAMDIFCLPSRREGYGMAYAEASAMAKPVVGAAVSPVDSIVVHGRTGLLVIPDDPAEIANALRQLLGDGALRRRLGSTGEQFVRQNCNMRDAWAGVLKVYGDVLNAEPVCSSVARQVS